MRGKDFNTGLRGVLFEARHYERMGAALWLYGWLVLRQTHQRGDTGYVLGGAPIRYCEIEQETGFNPRTLERWMHALRRHGYIETEAVPSGVIVRITKAKKFPQGTRASADTARKAAGGRAQNRGANRRYSSWNQAPAEGIGSSSVDRSKEDTARADIHRDFNKDFHRQPHAELSGRTNENRNPNPSCLGPTHALRQHPDFDFPAEAHLEQQKKFLQEARLRLQLIRAEREEAVRRELAVGTGPEVKRT
jgi:hypothetical protein